MKTSTLLHNGEFEAFKGGVHRVVLGTVALWVAYNFVARLVNAFTSGITSTAGP